MSNQFKQLNDIELEQFEKKRSMIRFTSGELLFKQDAPISEIVFLRTGCVKVLRESQKDYTEIVDLVHAPGFLCLDNALSSKRYRYSAISIFDTEVCFIDKNIFKETLGKNEDFTESTLQLVCTNGIEKHIRYLDISKMDVQGKLAWVLLYFSNHIFYKAEFKMPLTRQEIASLTGVSQRSLTRVLSDFEEEGLVESKGTKILLLDKKRLEQLM